MIERIDASVFELDMQSAAAGEQRQRQSEQDKRERADEELWHGGSDRGTAPAQHKQESDREGYRPSGATATARGP